MNCVICKNGSLSDGSVTVTLQRDNSVIIVKNVPASVCNNCGEYVLGELVTEKIMQLAEEAVNKNAEVEILQYAA